MGMALELTRYTIDDIDQFPEDGNRYEIINGALLVTPAPSFGHQIVANRIQARLTAALEWPGFARVVGPGAVVAPPRTQLQPDILVVPARFGLHADWGAITEHWLAVEVLSPSSRVYDCEVKRSAYFSLGVRQLWLVDKRERSVEVWRSPRAHHIERRELRWRVERPNITVRLDLEDLFAGSA